MGGLAQFDVSFLATTGLSLPADYDSRSHRYVPKYMRKSV